MTAVSIVDDLGAVIGERWLHLQRNSLPFNVAAPLSSTPLPVYEWLVDHCDDADWSDVKFVLMDEQLEGIEPPFRFVDRIDPASYESFADRHLLNSLRERTGAMLPVAKPRADAIEDFVTPIDLLILAIGPSGNYANVMPGTQREVGWHVAELSDEFRTAHTASTSRSYPDSAFRPFGMSLGPQQVLEAKDVIVIARGDAKRALVETLLGMDHFDPEFPISIIHDSAVCDRVEIVVASDVGVVP